MRWRNVVRTSIDLGIPTPAFTTALAYYDSYRSEKLPANLLQAQRDYFGAHTFHRLDKPGEGAVPYGMAATAEAANLNDVLPQVSPPSHGPIVRDGMFLEGDT